MQPTDEIREKINVVDLVGETVRLKKAGVNFRGLCPFHSEKTPSFTVSPAKQIWHCFGCGLGGDVFEFVKQSEGVDFPEALQILAARAGVTLRRPEGGVSYTPDQKKNLYDINNWAALFYSKVLSDSQTAKPARDYLQKRGFRPETLKQWQIGYAPDGFHAFEEFIVKKGYTKQEAATAGLLVKREDGSYFDRFHERVMFSLFDMHGRVVGFTARILKDQDGVSKYVNSPETLIYSKSRLIYGLNLAKTEIRKRDEVIVVEGNVDVITCHEFGFSNVVGSSGTAFTNPQLESLKRFTENISFALDADAAGVVATRRAVELALAAGFNVKIISIPRALAKDPDELIRKDPSLWENAVKSVQSFLDFYFTRILATMDLQSATGKKQAVREILPLLSLLPDSIDRVHYSQKLAGAVSVDPKVIIELLNKAGLSKFKSAQGGSSESSQSIPRKTKQEILEARVLGLILKFPEELALDIPSLKAEDFSLPVHREIFQTIAEAYSSGRLNMENLLSEHPKLATNLNLLVFALDNEISFEGGGNLESLKQNFLGQFREALIRKSMRQLTAEIKNAETAGNPELVKTLSLEFNHLAGELSKFRN